VDDDAFSGRLEPEHIVAGDRVAARGEGVAQRRLARHDELIGADAAQLLHLLIEGVGLNKERRFGQRLSGIELGFDDLSAIDLSNRDAIAQLWNAKNLKIS
jgi:hypothetical protein